VTEEILISDRNTYIRDAAVNLFHMYFFFCHIQNGAGVQRKWAEKDMDGRVTTVTRRDVNLRGAICLLQNPYSTLKY